LSFIKDNIEYTITSDSYDFKEVYDCSIQDDIIVVWTKPNDNDMICYICYNATNLALNLREINKIPTLEHLANLVKNNLFTHPNFLISKFGFASITDEDMANDKYSNTLAKEVSYKRALIEKMILDRQIISSQIEGLKNDYNILHTAIKRYNRMTSKIGKRIHDLRSFINNKISAHYPNTIDSE
jgi:hypothetical protein